MTVTKRDRWIILLLPVTTLLFFYGWFFFRPLNAKVKGLEARVRGYGGSADDFAFRIAKASREVKAAKEERTRVAGKIGGEKKAFPAGDLPDPAALAPEQRFERVSRHLEKSGITLLSAKRQSEGGREEMGDLFNPADFTRWVFRLQGTYPQILDFLKKNGEKGWGIPVQAEMSPPSEPGCPTEWTLTLYL